jgi:hypothetical protein
MLCNIVYALQMVDIIIGMEVVGASFPGLTITIYKILTKVLGKLNEKIYDKVFTMTIMQV